MEYWSIGVMEKWRIGIMECWKKKRRDAIPIALEMEKWKDGKKSQSLSRYFHKSITPSLQLFPNSILI
ncbi:MAG: hypothetical protein JEY97_06295 [Bacteroidales bacterium]|nr:hypothetical protein [Bacteroidales bacterium]